MPCLDWWCRTAFPVGLAKQLVSNHLLMSPIVSTWLQVTSARLLVPVLSCEVCTLIASGSPVRNIAMPFNCQPPVSTSTIRVECASQGRPGPNGSV